MNPQSKTYDKVVKETNVKILRTGEEFVLEDKHYSNRDQSIIVRSNSHTGRIFRPLHDKPLGAEVLPPLEEAISSEQGVSISKSDTTGLNPTE